MRKAIYLSSVCLLAFVSAAAAPETVVVTATRTPEPLEITGTSMSVITGDQIRQQQISFITDALDQTPGLTVVRNGGPGQNADILLRGAEAGQTLVLVDGIRINDPSSTSGIALMGDVLANNIDRVEVLRGPQSTLYGSDAIGGVVNLITARGGETALRVEAEGGSFSTVHLNAAANGTYHSLEFGAAGNFYLTNSVSAADSRIGNSEPDGYHHVGATANVRWNAMDGVSLDARLYFTKARDSFDGYPPPNYTFQDTHQWGDNQLLAFYGGLNVDAFGGRLSNRLAITHSDSDRKTFDPTLTPANDFTANGNATRLEYQGVFKLDDANEISFGAEDQRSGLVTQSIYDAAPTHGSNRIDGGYVQWQSGVIENVTLTAGGRFDHDREFGDHLSFKLAGAWQVADGTTLRANMGDGFKAPSLYQLFSPYSNPLQSLEPETATGWEAGIDQKLGAWRGSLTYFERRTSNQIDFFSCYGVSSSACTLRELQGGYYFNVNRSRARGVEVEIAGQISDSLSADINYTNLTDEDLLTGLQLARRPHNAANAVLTWQALPQLSIGAAAEYVGDRWDDAYHFTPLADSLRFNLFASYRVIDEVELFGRIENLTNNRSEPVAGYGTPGRAYFAGIRTKI
jgi:vitamin B12 transporter